MPIKKSFETASIRNERTLAMIRQTESQAMSVKKENSRMEKSNEHSCTGRFSPMGKRRGGKGKPAA